MKKIVLIIVYLTTLSLGQQWYPVGTEGFSVGGAEYLKLVFDGSTPYVAFNDWRGSTKKATVMKFNGIDWEAVGGEQFSDGRAEYISLAFYNEIPYVAFQDGASGYKATVMKLNDLGTGWEIVGNAGFSDYESREFSIAFNDSIPYVAFKDQVFGNANVMKFDADSNKWVVVGKKNFSDGKAYHLSFLISNKIPYVAFQDWGKEYTVEQNTYKATVMKFNEIENEWEYVGNNLFTDSVARYTNLVMHDTTLYITFGDATDNYKASVMKFNEAENAWNYFGSPTFSAGETAYTTIAFNDTTPYVAFKDYNEAGKATVMKLTDNGNDWEIVGSSGFSSGTVEYLSFTFAPNGIPVIAYMDYSDGKAVVMKYSNSPDDNFSDLVSAKKIETKELPARFLLEQNYPNPFNPSTMIKYSIPVTLSPVTVSLKVFNLLGQEVATLVNTQQSAGNYEVKFDAGNLASGIYLYKLQAGDFSSVKKLILMK